MRLAKLMLIVKREVLTFSIIVERRLLGDRRDHPKRNQFRVVIPALQQEQLVGYLLLNLVTGSGFFLFQLLCFLLVSAGNHKE